MGCYVSFSSSNVFLNIRDLYLGPVSFGKLRRVIVAPQTASHIPRATWRHFQAPSSESWHTPLYPPTRPHFITPTPHFLAPTQQIHRANMPEDYSCKICGTWEHRSVLQSHVIYRRLKADDSRADGWAGSGSTLEDCKACDDYLTNIRENLSRSLSNARTSWLPVNGTSIPIAWRGMLTKCEAERNRIAAVFIYRNRELEALNFCISSLERTSAACSPSDF